MCDRFSHAPIHAKFRFIYRDVANNDLGCDGAEKFGQRFTPAPGGPRLEKELRPRDKSRARFTHVHAISFLATRCVRPRRAKCGRGGPRRKRRSSGGAGVGNFRFSASLRARGTVHPCRGEARSFFLFRFSSQGYTTGRRRIFQEKQPPSAPTPPSFSCHIFAR